MAAATALATSLSMPSLALADAIPVPGNPAPTFSLVMSVPPHIYNANHSSF